MNLQIAIENLKKAIERSNIDPAQGIGEDLFLLVASLTPIMNIDLLIVKEGRILLVWRDDIQCRKDWHLPGGCLRLKKSLENRLHSCALDEVGSDVSCDMKPVLITESIESRRDWGRTHFISFLYRCDLDNEDALKNLDGKEIKGHLGWFPSIPKHFLSVQDFYRNFLTEEINRRRE